MNGANRIDVMDSFQPWTLGWRKQGVAKVPAAAVSGRIVRVYDILRSQQSAAAWSLVMQEPGTVRRNTVGKW